MQAKNVQVILIMTLAVVVVAPACNSTGKAAGASASTCPPGMAPAANQPICIHGHCANGLLDEREACDDGNLIAGDGCSPDCRSIETCGNHVVDHAVGEVCDDGNTESGDTCCADCRSCPERMAMFPAAAPAVEVGDRADQVLPPPPFASSNPPAPLLFAASLMPACAEAVSHGDAESTRMKLLIGRAHEAAQKAREMAKVEARARSQCAETQIHLIEQMQRDQEIMAQLEQANAELQAECQHFPSDRSNKLP